MIVVETSGLFHLPAQCKLEVREATGGGRLRDKRREGESPPIFSSSFPSTINHHELKHISNSLHFIVLYRQEQHQGQSYDQHRAQLAKLTLNPQVPTIQ